MDEFRSCKMQLRKLPSFDDYNKIAEYVESYRVRCHDVNIPIVKLPGVTHCKSASLLSANFSLSY